MPIPPAKARALLNLHLDAASITLSIIGMNLNSMDEDFESLKNAREEAGPDLGPDPGLDPGLGPVAVPDPGPGPVAVPDLGPDPTADQNPVQSPDHDPGLDPSPLTAMAEEQKSRRTEKESVQSPDPGLGSVTVQDPNQNPVQDPVQSRGIGMTKA